MCLLNGPMPCLAMIKLNWCCLERFSFILDVIFRLEWPSLWWFIWFCQQCLSMWLITSGRPLTFSNQSPSFTIINMLHLYIHVHVYAWLCVYLHVHVYAYACYMYNFLQACYVKIIRVVTRYTQEWAHGLVTSTFKCALTAMGKVPVGLHVHIWWYHVLYTP